MHIRPWRSCSPLFLFCFALFVTLPLILFQKVRPASTRSLQDHSIGQIDYKTSVPVSDACRGVRCTRPLKRSFYLSLDEVAFYAPPPPNSCPEDPSFLQIVPRGEGSRWIAALQENLSEGLNGRITIHEITL